MSESRVTGRPRSESSKTAILSAAFDLLTERGYADFALEAVAARAGVGKSTIYRWWPGKAALAVDAFFEATETDLRFPDTGTAEGDFRAQITQLATLLNGVRGRAFAAMLGGARTDPALAKTLGERWLAPRRAWGVARMACAATDGDLLPETPTAAALALLYGPLYAPLLFGGDVPDVEAVDAYLELACRGIFRQ